MIYIGLGRSVSYNSFSKKNIGVSLLSALIAFLLSAILMQSIDDQKSRNDLKHYQAHYNCLTLSISSIASCQPVLGKPIDILYQSFAYVMKFFYGNSGFYLFSFSFSFLVYFTVLYFSSVVVRFSLIPFLFLLSDFRFYELGSNVLRNGMAVSLTIIIFYFKGGTVLRLIPILAHLSTIPFLVARYVNINRMGYLFLLVSAFFLSEFVYFILVFLMEYSSPALAGKIYAYTTSMDYSKTLPPLQYVGVLFLCLYFYPILRKDYWFFSSFNVFFTFTLFAIVFQPFGIGYRFFNFVTPFAAISLSLVISYVARAYGKFAFIFLVLFMILAFLLIFWKNYEAIFRNF